MPSSDPQTAAPGSISHQQEPLIINNGDTEAQTRTKNNNKVSYRSLANKKQLAILCIARLADPLAASSIQTYMFYQLRFFNPDASDALISTQAGIIVGSKTAAQVCTGMLWGRLADSEWGGRKTVLLIGLVSSGLSCIGYRTRALLLLPLFANAGMLLGPLVGGLLSSENGHGLMKNYPYAPPNILAAVIYSIAAFGVLVGLKETSEHFKHTDGNLFQRLWRNLKQSNKSTNYEYTAINSDDQDQPESPLILSPVRSSSTQIPSLPPKPKPKARLSFRRIWTWNVLCTLLAHFIIAGHIATFTNLWSIFLSTPLASPAEQHPPFHFTGGLGMHPRQVGFAMSTVGAVGVTLQLAIYPLLNDRYGTIAIWRSALYVFPVAYLLAPFPSLVGSADFAHGKQLLVWLSIGGILLLYIIGRTGVTPATTLLIND
ncbi:hypothetical protein IFR05_011946, partial [Cadophora sp. M221]